jgi:hypothetical protein
MVVYYSQVPGVVLPSGVFVPINPLSIPSGWQWLTSYDMITVCSAVQAADLRAAEVVRSRLSYGGTEYELPYTPPLALGSKVQIWTDVKNIGDLILAPGLMWYIVCIDPKGDGWMVEYDSVAGDPSYIQTNGTSLSSVDVFKWTNRNVDPNTSLTNIKSPTFTVSRVGTYVVGVSVYHKV